MTATITTEQAVELYERYARPLEGEHWGEYVAITPRGEKIIEADLSKLQREAPEQVGPEHCLFKIGPRAVHRWLQGARTSPTYPSTVEVATLTLEALIDTGFEGFLALPAELLGDVRPRGFQVLQVANDEIVTANYYSSTVRVGSLQPVEGELTALGQRGYSWSSAHRPVRALARPRQHRNSHRVGAIAVGCIQRAVSAWCTVSSMARNLCYVLAELAYEGWELDSADLSGWLRDYLG